MCLCVERARAAVFRRPKVIAYREKPTPAYLVQYYNSEYKIVSSYRVFHVCLGFHPRSPFCQKLVVESFVYPVGFVRSQPHSCWDCVISVICSNQCMWQLLRAWFHLCIVPHFLYFANCFGHFFRQRKLFRLKSAHFRRSVTTFSGEETDDREDCATSIFIDRFSILGVLVHDFLFDPKRNYVHHNSPEKC